MAVSFIVGLKNSENIAVFTGGSWSCGKSGARHGRQYRHMPTAIVHCLAVRVAHDTADSTVTYLQLLYIYAEFSRVYRNDTPSFQSWNLRNSPLPSNAVYDLSSLRRHR